MKQSCDPAWLIVPLDSIYPGLPYSRNSIAGYECAGPLVQLGDFCDAEFFISPTDFEWTMVHTHEDHAMYGPCFLQRMWLEARS